MQHLGESKVVVEAKIENLDDLFQAGRGQIPAEQVRRVEVSDALIDTGATMLSMPRSLIAKLGLKRTKTRRAKTSVGIFEFGIYEAVRLTIQGRDCVIEVTEMADEGPPVIGKLPLEDLDFAIDPVGRRLIGNPDHGGENMFEMY